MLVRRCFFLLCCHGLVACSTGAHPNAAQPTPISTIDNSQGQAPSAASSVAPVAPEPTPSEETLPSQGMPASEDSFRARCKAKMNANQTAGFGPKAGDEAAFGMVNLTRPPSKKTVGQRKIAVSFGAVEVHGELNPDVAKQILRQSIGPLQSCYQSLHARRPNARGTVNVQLSLDECGFVLRADVLDGELEEPSMRRCLVQALRSLIFPEQPKAERTVTFSLSFSR